MDINKRIAKHFSDSAELKLRVKDSLAKPIAAAAQAFFDCVTNDRKILCCGNGGSAADAQHFSGELLNRFEMERPGLPAIAETVPGYEVVNWFGIVAPAGTPRAIVARINKDFNDALGSPKLGDKAAWAPRIATGNAALLLSAMKGKNAMPPQGGGDYQDIEIARAVVYLANAGGAKFAEPAAPAAAAPASAASAAK